MVSKFQLMKLQAIKLLRLAQENCHKWGHSHVNVIISDTSPYSVKLSSQSLPRVRASLRFLYIYRTFQPSNSSWSSGQHALQHNITCQMNCIVESWWTEATRSQYKLLSITATDCILIHCANRHKCFLHVSSDIIICSTGNCHKPSCLLQLYIVT